MEDAADADTAAAEELEALRAIFVGELEERSAATASAWKVRARPREYVLQLSASDSSLADKVNLRLVFRLPSGYPKMNPLSYSIEPIRGLSPQNVAELEAALKPYVHSLVGNVMVYDVAGFIQDFISTHNTVLASAQLSFHEQMQGREEQRKLEQATRELAEERLRRSEESAAQARYSEELASRINHEIERKTLLFQDAKGKWRDGTASVVGDGDPGAGAPSPTKMLTKGDIYENPMTLSKAKRGDLITNGILSAVYRCSFDDPSLSRAVIKVIEIDNAHYLTGEGRKKIEDVYDDICKVKTIVSPQIGIVYDCSLKQSENGIELTILEQEYKDERLQSLIRKCDGLNLRRAREVLMLLLQALAFLHNNNVTHRIVSSKYVALVLDSPNASSTKDESPSSDGIDLRLLGPLYTRKLLDLNTCRPLKLGCLPPAPPDPPLWVAPEMLSKRGTFSNKVDIWDLGCLAIEMIVGPHYRSRCTQEDWKRYLEQEGLPAQFIDLLKRMLNPDPKGREAALSLLAHPFFNYDYSIYQGPSFEIPGVQKQFSSLVVQGDKTPPFSVPSASTHLTSGRTHELSRYESDFDEIQFLGKGGYGEVVKARNRVDGRFYAIKKIRLNLNDKEETKRVLREVQTLSRLNHEYVVRYYTTWFEDAGNTKWAEDSEDDSESTEATDSDYSTSADATSDDDNSDSKTDGRVDGGLNPLTMGNLTDGLGKLSLTRPKMKKRRSQKLLPETDWVLRAHSSSISDISIRFANSSSIDPGKSKTANTDASTSSPATESSPVAHQQSRNMPKLLRVVYIQMEYCERNTLRDVINDGVDPKESWRLFRQITEGLDYIHSQGIFHRDLKPSNIFLDLDGNVKIGDLGLAFAKEEAVSKVTLVESDLDIDRSLTKDVGTYSYIAPEVVNGLKYNSKVDMYSLGICFFEMLYHFTTGMQRSIVIRELRKNPASFPSDFDVEELHNQHEILKLLLIHDAAKRPSAQEVLQSPYLPPKLEDDRMNEALRVIASQNNTTYYIKLLKTLFSQKADTEKDLTYEFNYNADINATLNALKAQVTKSLISVFQKHGACEQHAPLLVPQSGIVSTLHKSNVALLLDMEGNPVSLPYDLTLPFVRILAKAQANKLPLPFKRYCFDNVYRRNPASGQPRTSTEVDFDVVTTDLADNVPEAEVIRVVFEILQVCHSVHSIPDLRDVYSVYVNHGVLLDAIFDSSGIEADQDLRQKAFNILEFLDSIWDWKTVRQQLSKIGISQESLVNLESYYRLTDETDKGADPQILMLSLINKKYYQLCTTAIRTITALRAHLRGLGVKVKVILSPLLSYNATYYRTGLIFQVAARRQNKLDVVAAGGRYDYLISKFRYPYSASRKDFHAAGVNIPLSRLLSIVIESFKSSATSTEPLLTHHESEPGSEPTDSLRPNSVFTSPEYAGNFSVKRSNVVVIALGNTQELVEAKYSIVTELWDNGISADVSYNVPRDDVFLKDAQDNGYALCIFIKQPSGRSTTMIKLKNLITNVELEVARSEVLVMTMTELSEQNIPLLPGHSESRPRNTYISEDSRITGEPASLSRESTTSEQIAMVVTASNKFRGKSYRNRDNIIQRKTKQEVSRITRQLAGSDILIVDFPSDIVETMALSNMEVPDEELKKKFKHLTSNQRDYVIQVKKAILNRRKQNSVNSGIAHDVEFVWLCSSNNDAKPYIYRYKTPLTHQEV